MSITNEQDGREVLLPEPPPGYITIPLYVLRRDLICICLGVLIVVSQLVVNIFFEREPSNTFLAMAAALLGLVPVFHWDERGKK